LIFGSINPDSDDKELEGFTVSEEYRTNVFKEIEQQLREHPAVSKILQQPEFEPKRLNKLLNLWFACASFVGQKISSLTHLSSIM